MNVSAKFERNPTSTLGVMEEKSVYRKCLTAGHVGHRTAEFPDLSGGGSRDERFCKI